MPRRFSPPEWTTKFSLEGDDASPAERSFAVKFNWAVQGGKHEQVNITQSQQDKRTPSEDQPWTIDSGSPAGLPGRPLATPGGYLGFGRRLSLLPYFASGMMSLSASPGTGGTEATRARELVDQRIRQETPPEEFIVVESQRSTADQDDYAAFVDDLVRQLRASVK